MSVRKSYVFACLLAVAAPSFGSSFARAAGQAVVPATGEPAAPTSAATPGPRAPGVSPAAPKSAVPPVAAPVGLAPKPAASPAAPAMGTAANLGPGLGLTPLPNRPPVVEVVTKIQKVYESTTSLKANFNQVLTSAMGKRQASGIVQLKKPGKMRWDYLKPEKKLFVADGTMIWMYEPEDEQAFRQPLSSSQLPAQVSFLFGRGRLLDEFDITYLDGAKDASKDAPKDPPKDAAKLGEAGDYVLKLVPKKATAQYRHLVFVVSPKTFMVKETVLYDQQGGTNHLAFSAIETNLKTLDDSRFSFTPPAGTKIINPNH